jgi:beta-glucanase (GH16 family)
MPRFSASSFRLRVLLRSSTLVVLTLLGIFRPLTPCVYAVTNLVFDEEFNSSSSNVDLTKWSFDLGNSSTIAGGGWGNSELETYTSRTNNAYVAGGVLHIIALNDQGGGAPYSSARIHTLGHFSMTYGRVEYRAKLPSGSPYWWPALWMLATNYSGGTNPTNNWPECGEIDVMENKGSAPTKEQSTLVYDNAGSPGSQIFNSGTFTFPAGDGVTNFHTYVISWSSNSISFSVDSNVAWRTISTWTSSVGSFPTPFNHPFYLIMNLAVGGNFVGTPSVATVNGATTFPGEMQVDYVRVYEDTNGVFGPPGVTSIVPNNGCQGGGTFITINGSNFVSGTTVSIGALACTNIVVTTNAITCFTPGSATASSKSVVLTYPDTTTTNITHGYTYNGPPAFAGLAGITPAVGGATLTWSTATGGTAPVVYKVYEATSTGGENFGSPVLTTSSLSAFFSLNPGTNCTNTYYFVVRTSDGCNATDGNSVELSVQPISPAPTFAGLGSVTAGIDAATLTWSAASGGTPPYTYNVFESTTGGAENFASPLLSTNVLTLSVPLYPGSNSPITYFFVVRAQGGCASDSNLVEQSIQPLLDPNGDQTGNGIPNGWLQQYGFNPFDTTVASADSDGDGVPNLQEYLTGTDPTNSASYFHLISITPQGNDVLITWMCGGGRTNVVQSTYDPTVGYSALSSNIVLSGSGDSVTNYLDTGAGTNSTYFYRILFVP